MGATLKKNAKGYGYNYTDLPAVNEYISKIHGSYYQFTVTDPCDGCCYVMTHRFPDDLLDEGIDARGAKVVDATLSNGKMNPAQANGSALTYARRYSLHMAYGLATTDDDAESLTIPAESIADFPAPKKSMRSQIVAYCKEHNLDVTQTAEEYGITKGLSESVLEAKLNMLKRDYGDL